MPLFAGLGYSGDDPNKPLNPNDTALSGGASFQQQGFAGAPAPAAVPSFNMPALHMPRTMDTGGYNPMGIAGIGMNPSARTMAAPVGASAFAPGEPATSSTGPFYNPAMGSDVAHATYDAATQYFNPDFERETNAQENRLMNQGFARGSEAFDAEMGKLQRTQDQARTSAALGATVAGNNQALGIANLNLGARGQDNTMSQAELQAQIAMRSLGISEDSQQYQQLMALIASARGGVPALGFGSPAPLDVTGAYGVNQSAANANANARGANSAGLYNLGATLLGSYFGR